jgi:CRISPR-associated protein Csb2
MATDATTADAPLQRVSIGFTFLNGVYFAASRTADRSEPEWPPHFGRAFMAMTAALYRRTRAADNAEYVAERAALLALEELPAPLMYAPSAHPMEYPTVYVRSNHVKGMQGKAVIRLLPGRHMPRERHYPGYTIREGPNTDPAVHFIWEGVHAQTVLLHAEALRRLLAYVAYLGTSRSLVAAEICPDPPPATHIPLKADERPSPSDYLLRVAGEGRLQALNRHFEARKRLDVPPVGEACRYRRAESSHRQPPEGSAPASIFGDMFVYRLDGRDWLPITHTLIVTHGFRELVLARAGDLRQSPGVCGHGEDDEACPPHVGWMPLANVGYDYSNGRILGVAVVLPRIFGFGTVGRDEILQALAGLQATASEGAPRLRLNPLGCPEVRPVEGVPDRESLRTARYTATARFWASVTPFVSEFLGSRDNHDSRRLVRRACRRIGLPDPLDCALTRTSPIRGVPPADHFLTGYEPAEPALRCSHVLLDFGRPVRGPVLIGRYRYFGMGMCLPWTPQFSRERP